eukprot:35151-Eustigmatos_ZCMA.PRE.1
MRFLSGKLTFEGSEISGFLLDALQAMSADSICPKGEIMRGSTPAAPDTRLIGGSRNTVDVAWR